MCESIGGGSGTEGREMTGRRTTIEGARVVTAERDQLELQVVDLEGLIAADHRARQVWAFVEELDLSELYAAMKARDERAGRPSIDPKILLAVWLYATIEGIGSGREVERLCRSDHAYRWLCGGVAMSYRTLSEFRSEQGALLDRLLTQSVAALVAEGLVKLEEVAQDGVRIRASAGAGSFRRRARLETLVAAAEARVAALKQELEDDPAASSRRRQAARERGARERAERTRAALEEMKKIEALREKRSKTNKEQVAKQGAPRASTSDPQARTMKMADGGFRPAYNVQIASTPDSQIVLAVDAANVGSDRGLLAPMADHITGRYGVRPERLLADGGFNKNTDIERLFAAPGGPISVYCPPVKSRHGRDPYQPRPDDGPGMADWRRRMASEAGQAIYRRRAIHECINAGLRNRGLHRFFVRGLAKAKTIALWHALAHNCLRNFSLRAAVALA